MVTVALKNFFVWFAGQLGVQLQEYVTRDLRDAVYRHLQRLPIGWFTRNKTGQILSRVLSDTAQTKQLITQIVTSAIQSAAVVIIYIAYLWGISRRLTLIALVLAPALILALRPLLSRLRKRYRRLHDDHGEMMSVLQESVSGIRLVKSFSAEGHEEEKFVDASHRYSKGLVRTSRLALLSQPITETMATTITVLLLWYGATLVLDARVLQALAFLVFLTLVMRMLGPLKALSQLPTVAQSSLAAADRLFEVLDVPTEIEADRGTRTIERFEREMVFDDVSFAYEADPVLSNVSFAARKGDVIALVGPSGAGKSTMADLIPRFYEPTSGRITLDGIDTREDSLAIAPSLDGDRQSGNGHLQRYRPQQRCLRHARAIQRRSDRGGRARSECARVHHRASSGVRHVAWRARCPPLRRPATADRDRPCAPHRPADSHSR